MVNPPYRKIDEAPPSLPNVLPAKRDNLQHKDPNRIKSGPDAPGSLISQIRFSSLLLSGSIDPHPLSCNIEKIN
jgi:hypothetical protein